MKSIRLFAASCLFALVATSLSAQTSGINYQAVLRNAAYQPIGNQSGTATVSILNGAAELYREIHIINTDQLGLFNIVIGRGSAVAGNFATLDWGAGNRFLNISVSVGGNTYTFAATELQAVPYAKVAERALNASTALSDNDSDTKIQVEKNPDEDVIRFDLGGSEKLVLAKTSAGVARLEFPNNQRNIFVGTQAGWNNTSGDKNIAIGHAALSNNTIRAGLVAIGDSALVYNGLGANPNSSEACCNVAVGRSSLRANTTGYSNTAIGDETLRNNTTGYVNTAIGAGALNYNTTGHSNVGVGMAALLFNTTGQENTSVGTAALIFNSEGNYNTAIGRLAMHSNTTGSINTAVGMQALFNNQSGIGNTVVGNDALYSNNTGERNSVLGWAALYSNTTGENNTAIGVSAMDRNTTGSRNSALGSGALFSNEQGSFNTAVGRSADVAFPNLTNATALGADAKVNASNKVRIGSSAVTVIEGQVNFSATSDGRFKQHVRPDVPGLAFIQKLKPVTYTFDLPAFSRHLGEEQDSTRAVPAHNLRFTGFIAQDVEKAAREIGFDFSGVCPPENEQGTYGLRYAEFTVPLVKAVQEQQEQIETLKRQNEQLRNESAALKAGAQRLEARLEQLEKHLENIQTGQ